MTVEPPATGPGRLGWQRLVSDPGRALLAFDFDGTLSPVVDDPEQAYAHPGVVPALVRLSPVVGTLAVVTGRPVTAVLRLADIEGAPTLSSLVVLGQYGVERWEAASGEVVAPPPPEGVARVREALPGLLAELGLSAARVEDKGRAVAVHVRGLPGASEALERLRGPVERLAAEHGLTIEPGRLVLELRGSGMDKGQALRSLVESRGADCVVYAGDDLGDLAAYDAVDAMREQGRAGLLLCSASTEQDALTARADIVLPGPEGLVAWLEGLADQLGV